MASQFQDATCAQCSTCALDEYIPSGCDGMADTSGCQPKTLCAADEFRVSDGTPFSDRSCVKLTSCNNAAGDRNAYELVPASVSSDRTCGLCSTRCAGNYSYINTNCSAAADVSCTACSVCAADAYVLHPCTLYADAVCRTCTLCTAGLTYEARSCQQWADRRCGMCATCSSDQYAAASCTFSADTTCQTLTLCTILQFETQSPSGTSDRSCANVSLSCPVGISLSFPNS